MNSAELISYYESHRDEFPVVFTCNQEWNLIKMHAGDYYGCIADINGDVVRVYIDDDDNAVWTSLGNKCKQYQFNYDLEKPHDVLAAFVDVTYNTYAECIENIRKRMFSILNRHDND